MLKKLDLPNLIPNILLAFCIGLTGAGCLSTAFSLDVAPGNILLACAFWALAINIALRIPKGGWIGLGLMVLWGLHFWWKDYLQDMKVLLHILFSHYRAAYGWTLPDFLVGITETEVTFAVTSLAAVCTMIAGFCLQAASGTGAIIALVLPLLPCLVVTDTVPATVWLFAMFVLIGLLLITNHVRKVEPRQAGRLTALMLIPILLACSLLFIINPRDSYDKASDEETFGGRVLELLDKLPFVSVDENGDLSLDFGSMPPLGSLPSFGTLPPFTVGSGGNITPTFILDPSIVDIFKDSVSLGNAGPRNPANVNVMSIVTDFRGTLYLRERGYDIYTGISWDSSGQIQDVYADSAFLSTSHDVQITTYWAHSNYFLPYYQNPGHALEDGHLPNPGLETTYTLYANTLISTWQDAWDILNGTPLNQLAADADFTALPDATRLQAQAILAQIGITENLTVVQAAERIRNYVRSSATYDLNTPAMPEDATDFALWFLTESDTGYCVHFASAATVLLRAAGIPARYVEGYMTAVTGKQTVVPAKQAHAWVEYFVQDVGWVVLEATPGGSDTPVPPETTLPPETTTPPETALPPQTTVPPTTFMPPETTVPSATIPGTQPEETQPLQTTAPPETTAPSTPAGTTTPTTVPGTSIPGTSAPGTSSSAATSVPSTSGPSVPEPGPDRTGLWITLSSVLFLLGSLCALIGQWQLRLWLQQVWCRRGSSNQQALAMWPVCRKLAKLRRQKAPTALRDLAWKAKYSQYTLTEDELQEFRGYMDRSIEHLKKRPWYLRIVYRVIFAAY